MKFRITFLTLTFLIFVACNNNKTKIARQSNGALNKQKSDSPRLSMRHIITAEDTLTQQQIDTAKYANLPYWSKNLDCFTDAYIDTFSVGSNKFRFVSPIATHRTGGNSVTLQKLVNGKWFMTNLTLEDNIHGGHFFYNEDINGDGYIDIENWLRFSSEVYFYNPQTNSFIDTPAKKWVNPGWVLLDKAKKIYCDFQEYKRMCRQINSKLYTYQGFERIDLYNLNLYNCTETNDETNLITKLVLSKYIGGYDDSTVVVEETKLAKPIDADSYNDNGKYPSYFDYKKYWLRRYKKLLNIK